VHAMLSNLYHVQGSHYCQVSSMHGSTHLQHGLLDLEIRYMPGVVCAHDKQQQDLHLRLQATTDLSGQPSPSLLRCVGC